MAVLPFGALWRRHAPAFVLAPLVYVVLFGLASPVTRAQGDACPRPAAPSDGFAVQTTQNVLVLYEDGYATRGDLALPNTLAPDCGWPLVVLIHPFQAERKAMAAPAKALAAQGYAVWTYDVRGHGDARLLNQPGQGFAFMGPDAQFDLAEQVRLVRTVFPSLVHADRLAITGPSQGGAHAWFAAARSRQLIEVAGRGSIPFPAVHAVVAEAFVPEAHDHMLRGGTLFQHGFVRTLLGAPDEVDFDDGFVATTRAAFMAQDPAGLLDTWAAEPNRLWGDALAASAVPSLWFHAYHDGLCAPLPGIERFAAFSPNTPTRMLLSTGGHGSVRNDYEFALRLELRRRWFDRFLWDEPNGVDHEAHAIQAGVPLDPVLLEDPKHTWTHGFDAQLPPDDHTPRRYYLSGDGALSTIEPRGGGAPSAIRHEVAPGFTPTAWAALPGEDLFEQTLEAIPLSEQVFSTAPLADESELGERVTVSLSITPDAPRFTVAAMLSARLPGAADDVSLALWGRGVLDAQPGQPMRLELDLPPAVCVLPEGTVVRLTLRNHWIGEAPLERAFSTVPYFDSSSISVHHGVDDDASFIDIPFRRRVRTGLTSPVLSFDLYDPEPQTLSIDGGKARAGAPYIVLLSLSGQAPGLTLPAATVPLAPDLLTQNALWLVANGAAPYLSGFLGDLDADGRATAVLDWTSVGPLPSELQGHRVTLSVWTASGAVGEMDSVSNPLDVYPR